jgi:hypothetical protein
METNESLYQFLLEEYKKTSKIPEVSSVVSHEPSKTRGDYVPYPDPRNVAEFNNIIAKKKEFWDIQGRETGDYTTFDEESSARCNSGYFKVAPHQIFVKRFLSPQTPYQSLLLFHDVGVGKTCTAISIAEQYLNLYDKRVLVILSSTLRDNFKKQIFDITRYDLERHTANLCTGTRYADMVVNRAHMAKDEFEKAINKIIMKHYQFMGYKELFELLKKIREHVEKTERDAKKHERRYKSKIEELFSDRLIIIDEAHNLRSTSDEVDKRISQAFMEMISNVKNVKLLLMTATPMFNDPREIVWLLNILLTNDRRPTIKISDIFDKFGTLTAAGKAKLIEVCTGYVSYMRGENPFSFPVRIFPREISDRHLIKTPPEYDIMGDEIPVKKRSQNVQLIGSTMSPSQLLVYEDMLTKPATSVAGDEDEDEDEDEDGSEDNKQLQVQNLIQVCNCVFPMVQNKITYGSVGFNQCFDRNKNKISYSASAKKHGQFLKYGSIAKYAPKIKRIIDYVLNASGIVFVYSQFYYSGIIPLALALEHVGFNKHGGNLGQDLEVEQRAKLIDGKRPNYVILSRDSDLSPNNTKEIATLRSRDNMHGGLIKVVIVSKIGTEGLDLKNIREMHLLDPWYNMNRAEQIIGRGVRTCSHIDLPKEHRNVTLFLHAVTHPDEIESFDQRVYRIAEIKQRKINAVENILKSHAIDCTFNLPNLIFPPERLRMTFDIETSQGIKLKNYKIGDAEDRLSIKCAATSTSTATDTSTFTKDMIADEINIYKGYIASTFKGVTRNTYKDIIRELRGKFRSIDEDIVKYVLDELVESREVFSGYHDNRGVLTFAGNKYVFKPFLEIVEFDRRSRLPLDALANNKQINPSPPKPAPKTPVSSDGDIHKEIEKRIKDVEALLNGKYRQHIVDYVIDRLTTVEMQSLLRHPIPTHLEQSIRTSRCVLYDGGAANKIIGFYNFRDAAFYVMKSTGFVKASPLDLTKWSAQVTAIRSALVTVMPEEVKGYLQAKDNDDVCKFKVRDGKTSGYVCAQTHTLQVDELRARITAIDATALDKHPKLTKVKLCCIYEILMRHQGKFMRPQMAAIGKI